MWWKCNKYGGTLMLTCGQNGSNGNEIVTQINDNTNNIETNTQDILDTNNRIGDVELRVDNLEALTGNFHFDSRTDILDISDTYTEIGNVFVQELPAGVYMLGMSATYSFDDTTKSVYFEFSVNGNPPEEFRQETKDVTDRVGFDYLFPFTHNGGEFRFVLSVRKEDTSGTLDCYYSNVWADRKS